MPSPERLSQLKAKVKEFESERSKILGDLEKNRVSKSPKQPWETFALKLMDIDMKLNNAYQEYIRALEGR